MVFVTWVLANSTYRSEHALHIGPAPCLFVMTAVATNHAISISQELIIDPSKPIQAEINAMDTASDTAAATSGSGHHPGDPLVSSHAVPAVPTPSGHYSNDPLSESCPGLSIPLGLGSTGGTRALTSVKGGSGGQLLEGHDVTAVDHPLSLEASSRWNTFFQVSAAKT